MPSAPANLSAIAPAIAPADIFAAPRRHTIRSLVLARAAQSPDRAFLILPESARTITYGDLARALTALRRRIGVAAGEPLGFFGGNSWAAAQVLLGAPFHNRPALLFNLAAGDAQLVYMLNHSGCRQIFADEENAARLRNLAAECERPPQIEVTPRDNNIAVDQDGDGGIGDDSDVPANDSAALLIYTSGTTGAPKGVVHSHRSWLAGGVNTAIAHELSADDRALCVLPLYHINGQCVTILAPLLSGGSVVLPYRFSASAFWDTLAAHRCAWFSAVPTILSHLLHSDAAKAATPDLRFARSASAPLAAETHRQFEQRFGAPLVETMGLTETAAQILSNPPPRAGRGRGKIGSPGRAVGCEVRIIRAGGGAAATGEEGEIAVRGDNVMAAYWRSDAAVTDADGWFLTGDLGQMDADGYVFVTGRLKELIIKGGENIAPREVDDALYAADGVVEAAAFGAACRVYGQQVEAAVVLSRAGVVSESDLIALCHQRIGAFKSPRCIHFLAELPKGPSGKIQRLKLARLLTRA